MIKGNPDRAGLYEKTPCPISIFYGGGVGFFLFLSASKDIEENQTAVFGKFSAVFCNRKQTTENGAKKQSALGFGGVRKIRCFCFLRLRGGFRPLASPSPNDSREKRTENCRYFSTVFL